MPSFTERVRNSWNAFLNNKDPSEFDFKNIGYSYSYRPDRPRMSMGNERSIVTAIYNRLALDVAAIHIAHVRVDENERFIEEIESTLDHCLRYDANLDQTGRAFIQDVVMSMFDEGCIAIVPVDTDESPLATNSYDILSLRVGKIIQWYPKYVKVRLYNENTGKHEELTLPKMRVAIVENPFYAVMNESNSTLKRLIRKLTILDVVDEQNGAGKLDLVIQLPFVIKSEGRRQQAENRRKDIEMQLSQSKYGIAYTDGSEHITQLNRSVENQLLPQIEYLINLLYSQLGITAEIMNGTADEEAMLNYHSRTLEPIVSSITDEMSRKFLTKTARTQGQKISFFTDPFKLVPVSKLAELVDKFTRNEVMTSNEFRGVIGLKPSDDPAADELRNKNMPIQDEEVTPEEVDNAVAGLDEFDSQLDDLERQIS